VTWGSGSFSKKNKRSKAFFFEKKKQKTFDYLAAMFPDGARLHLQKFFGSFFQKRTAWTSLNNNKPWTWL
jgi:hypothetical protein